MDHFDDPDRAISVRYMYLCVTVSTVTNTALAWNLAEVIQPDSLSFV